MPSFYLICSNCGKKVKIDKEKMGDLGKIQNFQLRSFNCPFCGTVLATEINK